MMMMMVMMVIMMLFITNPWLETSTWWQAGLVTAVFNSGLCRRDSESGQMLMTCGKLSNQAPSVKTDSMAHVTVLPSNCWGYRVD